MIYFYKPDFFWLILVRVLYLFLDYWPFSFFNLTTLSLLFLLTKLLINNCIIVFILYIIISLFKFSLKVIDQCNIVGYLTWFVHRYITYIKELLEFIKFTSSFKDAQYLSIIAPQACQLIGICLLVPHFHIDTSFGSMFF